MGELTPAPGSPLAYLDGVTIELVEPRWDPVAALEGCPIGLTHLCSCRLHTAVTEWVWPGTTSRLGHVVLVPVGEARDGP